MPGAERRLALTVVNERDDWAAIWCPITSPRCATGASNGWPYSYFGKTVDARVKPPGQTWWRGPSRPTTGPRPPHRVPGLALRGRLAPAAVTSGSSSASTGQEPQAAQRLQGDLRPLLGGQTRQGAAAGRAHRVPRPRGWAFRFVLSAWPSTDSAGFGRATWGTPSGGWRRPARAAASAGGAALAGPSAARNPAIPFRKKRSPASTGLLNKLSSVCFDSPGAASSAHAAVAPLSLIAAVSRNGVHRRGGQLPWDLPRIAPLPPGDPGPRGDQGRRTWMNAAHPRRPPHIVVSRSGQVSGAASDR